MKQTNAKADFAALLDAKGLNYRRGFNPGEAVNARVLSTKGQYVILDVGAKDEGIVPKEEFILEDGTLRAQEGETIKVWFVAMRQGNMTFTARNKAAGKGSEVVATAFSAGTPIDGLVKSEIKGGFEVEVAGIRGFCPYSQIDLYRNDNPSQFVGTTQTFLVTEYGEDDRGVNLLVSRRALLERERKTMRAALFADLAEGQIREGAVTRLMDFGVFVDLGGAEGLVPMRELSWDRAAKAADLVKVGDSVEVLVQHFDVVTERISLSLRAMHQNPWDAFAGQYRQGDTLTAKIVRITTFGAFAQLAPAVDGLITNGRLSLLAKGRRIASAHEVVEVGQTLEVKIDTMDVDQHKIALSPVVVVEAPAATTTASTETDPEEDPQTWLRANRAKNAAMNNNPFAGLSL
jgi:small subunit ribosomal protein S1